MVEILKKFSYDDCIKGKFFRRIPPSKEKAERSIRAAQKWLEEADTNFKSKAFNSSVMSSFLVMFHSSRAILFFDGFREKSHYCIARYLEEKYVKNKLLDNKYVNLLDHYRELRHNSQYDLSFFASKEEAKNMLDCSKEFVDQIINLLEKKK